MSVVSSKINKQSKEMENKQMTKVALVISNLVLSMFAFAVANAYNYTAIITDNTNDHIRSAIWNFVGIQFIFVSVVLALVFIIRSRQR
jgi:uncharacterized Tic20 family protein